MTATYLPNQEPHRTSQTSAALVNFVICLSLFTGLFVHDIWDESSNDALIEQLRLKSVEIGLKSTYWGWEILNKTFIDSDRNAKNSKPIYFATQEPREQHIKTTYSQKLASEEFLCKIGYNYSCYSRGPADVIETFWAVGPVYVYTANQSENAMLYEFHTDFRDYIKSIGVSFCTIEGIRGELNQVYQVTKAGREPEEIQVTLYDEDYIRENLVNVALKKIPSWEYVAWIDAHQYFENAYWWEESIVKMEKHGAVQPFKTTKRFDWHNQSSQVRQGALALTLVQYSLDNGPDMEFGNAFAIRREMYEAVGGIIDNCLASGCDVSYIIGSIPPYISFGFYTFLPNYVKNFQFWTDRMREVFKGDRAYIRGALFHKAHLRYFAYGEAMWAYEQAHFNFTLDTTKDENGTIKITNPEIRQLIPNLRFYYSQGWY